MQHKIKQHTTCSDCEYRLQGLMAKQNLSRFDKVCGWCGKHEGFIAFVCYISMLLCIWYAPR